ncbi:MAG: SpoIIE family protein phosphatase [Spirochaetaceae bacterium]|nr:SpoIIE family protein phosphatase [Spirochaetaceae bacterium]
MKIRVRFTLLQLLIIAGFLGSMSFVFIQFSRVYHLKQLEIQSIQTSTALRTLEQDTRLFSSRHKNLRFLWEDWKTSFQQFDTLYAEMLNNPYHRLLRQDAIVQKKALDESWTTVKEMEIQPLTGSFQKILSSNLPALIGDNGIKISSQLIGLKEGTESVQVQQLAEIEADFDSLKDSLVMSISIPTEHFIINLSDEIELFSSKLYRITIVISILIQAGGIFFVLLFTRSFSRNTIELERTMAKVSDGNFNINLDIHSGDEFEDISKHFNALTQDLWNRIESMKDMMRDIGSLTGEDTEIGELEDFILELAIDNTGADTGIFMTVEEGMLVLRKALGYFPPPMPLPPMVSSKREFITDWFKNHRIAPGEGILGYVIKSGEPRFVRDNMEGELPDNVKQDSDTFINSAIFIPLIISGSTVGILALALTRIESVFTDMDYAYMRSYGEFISLTLDNMQKYHELLKSHQINREIEVAADIQKTLLPERLPSLNNAEVAAFSDAAKGVSGDYYDIFDLGGGKTAVIICDVSGKGVPASLLMIMIRTIIRSISSPEKRSDRIMAELNRAVTGRMGADRFATISIIILDAENGTLSYSNGAHHPLYILRGETGKYRMFDTDGLPLGIDINASFGHKRIRVRTNDYLVLFTDGLPEARNTDGEELGTDRLLKFIARHADQTPRELTRRVKDYIEDFTSGTKHDDQTFVTLKVG